MSKYLIIIGVLAVTGTIFSYQSQKKSSHTIKKVHNQLDYLREKTAVLDEDLDILLEGLHVLQQRLVMMECKLEESTDEGPL